MPIYEYRCENCATLFPLLRRMEEADAPASCPDCQGPAVRSISAFASPQEGRLVLPESGGITWRHPEAAGTGAEDTTEAAAEHAPEPQAGESAEAEGGGPAEEAAPGRSRPQRRSAAERARALQQRLRTLTRAVRDLDADRVRLVQEISRLSTERAAAEREAEESAGLRDTLLNAVRGLDERREELRSAIVAAEAELEALRQAVDGRDEERQHLQESIVRVRGELEELERQAAVHREEAQRLSESSENAEMKLYRVVEELGQRRREVAGLEERRDELTAAIERMEEERRQAEEALSQEPHPVFVLHTLQQELATLEEAIVAQRGEQETVRETLARLSRDVEERQARRTELATAIEYMEQERWRAEQALARRRQELAALEEDIAGQRREQEFVQETLVRTAGEVEDLQARKDELAAEVERLEAGRRRAEEAIAQRQRELAGLEQSLTARRGELQAAHDRLAEVAREVEEREARRDELAAAIERLDREHRHELAALRETITEHQSEQENLAQLTQQVEERQTRRNELVGLVERLDRERQQVESMLSWQRQELASVQESVGLRRRELDSLERDIRLRTDEKQALAETVQETRSRMRLVLGHLADDNGVAPYPDPAAVAAHGRELAGLAGELSAVRGELESFRQQLVSAREEEAGLREQAARRRGELAELERALAERRRELQEARSEWSQGTTDMVAQLEGLRESLRIKHQEAMAALADLRQHGVVDARQVTQELVDAARKEFEEIQERITTAVSTAYEQHPTLMEAAMHRREELGQTLTQLEGLGDSLRTAQQEAISVVSELRERGIVDVRQVGQEITSSVHEAGRELREQLDALLQEVLTIAGKAAQVDADIRSKEWLSRLLLLMEGNNGLQPQEVRVLSVTVLGSLRSWLDEHPGAPLPDVRPEINRALTALRGWEG